MGDSGVGQSAPPLRHWVTLRNLGRRATEARFWLIQLMVIGVSAAHLVVEYTEEQGHLRGFWHGLQAAPVEAYLIPVVLGAIWYGLEGGVLTALLAASLSVPNLVLFHRDEFSWLGEGLATLLVLGVGVVVATIVERLRVSQIRLESANSRLLLLNDITAALNRSDEPEDLVATTLHHLVDGAGIPAAVFSPDIASADLSVAGVGEAAIVQQLSKFAPESAAEPGPGSGPVAARVQSRRGSIGWLLAECASRDVEAPLIQQVARELAVALHNSRERDEERLELQRYTWAITIGQERERKRLARDLHDGPAQSLVYVARGLGRLARSDDVEHGTLAAELREEAQRALNSIRRATWALRPALLDDLGLRAALESLLQEQRRRSAIKVDFVSTGEPIRLSPDLELASFRIVQEALSNVHRHSGAQSVGVLLEFQPGRIRLEIRDDGCGFDVAANGRDWFGLTGMRERAELVGGDVRVRSEVGTGTVVEFEAPTP